VKRFIIAFLVVWALLFLAFSVASAINVVVVDTPTYTGTLKVEPIPAQPSLRVVNGESVVNADGTVNWQPAGGLKLQ
jgi:hypothetical protein